MGWFTHPSVNDDTILPLLEAKVARQFARLAPPLDRLQGIPAICALPQELANGVLLRPFGACNLPRSSVIYLELKPAEKLRRQDLFKRADGVKEIDEVGELPRVRKVCTRGVVEE